MFKVAHLQEALEERAFEKQAKHLSDYYGTSQGYLPSPYLHAFDRMEKDAGLQAIGKGVTGAMYRAGKFLAGPNAGVSGARQGFGGKLMDFASRVGGKASSGAAQNSLAMMNAQRKAQGLAPLTAEQFAQGQARAQQMVGGAALATGAAGLGTAGLATFGAGRMSKD